VNRIEAEWINRPDTQKVAGILDSAGRQIFFVGGCVRNTLLGEPVDDIDIATDAPPEEALSLYRSEGLTVVPTGIDHGTITVMVNHVPYEITTFRRDIETDGRHARVQFSDNLAEDARRRDFTMNALYASRHGEIVDPLGGLGDLQARRVRFIGDPDARIREDYLRILRFFRFHAWYGNSEKGLDPAGLHACEENQVGMETLSRERITAELLKLLAAPDPVQALQVMGETGILERILPGSKTRAVSDLVGLEYRHGLTPAPLRRLAALGDTSWQARLHLSRSQRKTLERLRDPAIRGLPAAVLGYRLGRDLAMDAVLIHAAETGIDPEESNLSEIERGAAAKFPLKAADLMPEYTGPALGRRLAELERRWIESGFSLSRDELCSEA